MGKKGTYEWRRHQWKLARDASLHVGSVASTTRSAHVLACKLHVRHGRVLRRDVSFANQTLVGVERNVRLAVHTESHLSCFRRSDARLRKRLHRVAAVVAESRVRISGSRRVTIDTPEIQEQINLYIALSCARKAGNGSLIFMIDWQTAHRRQIITQTILLNKIQQDTGRRGQTHEERGCFGVYDIERESQKYCKGRSKYLLEEVCFSLQSHGLRGSIRKLSRPINRRSSVRTQRIQSVLSSLQQTTRMIQTILLQEQPWVRGKVERVLECRLWQNQTKCFRVVLSYSSSNSTVARSLRSKSTVCETHSGNSTSVGVPQSIWKCKIVVSSDTVLVNKTINRHRLTCSSHHFILSFHLLKLGPSLFTWHHSSRKLCHVTLCTLQNRMTCDVKSVKAFALFPLKPYICVWNVVDEPCSIVF